MHAQCGFGWVVGGWWWGWKGWKGGVAGGGKKRILCFRESCVLSICQCTCTLISLSLTLTEQILFSGWIHTHKWFSSETYSLASILGSLIACCFGALVFCQTWHWSRIMQHMYGTDDNAEPIDCLVFSIKRTPYQFFLQLELFGDRLKRIETCRGKWRHGR